MLTIRPAQTVDAAALAQLGITTFCETFGHLYKPSDLQNYLARHFCERIQLSEINKPENAIFMAYYNDEPAGFAKLRMCELPVEDPILPAVELHRLYVLAHFQNIGIGNDLMRHIIEEAQSWQASALYLSVWEHNVKAQEFYKKWGFSKVGTADFYVGEQVDHEWILERPI